MMPPPVFASPFPSVQSGPANYGSPLMSQPARGYAMPPPSPPARPQLAQQQTPSPRIIRGQQPDELMPAAPPAPIVRQAPLQMPSPEELGVAEAKRSENPRIDWTAVHNQFDRLGATCFHLEKMPKGGYRITCLLPTNQRDLTHRIEAEAPNEADAVHLTLAKAQEWAQR